MARNISKYIAFGNQERTCLINILFALQTFFYIYITFTCIIVIWFKVDINVGYTLSLNSI